MARLFGTDGVRGVANRDLTPELVFQLGYAAARVLCENQDNPFFVVGKDTRYSGDMLESALISGVLSAGVDVVQLGVLPTPGVAYVTRSMGATAGVMISASHNPMQDNGIKFFGADGFKLLDAIEDMIELELGRIVPADRPIGDAVGRVRHHHHGLRDYMEFLKETVRHPFTGLKIAVDAANGAAYAMAGEVLRSLGADVFLFHAEPDGANINVHCGSTHPHTIAKLVRETGADVGLAFDGDADRLIAVDEKGCVIDGDRIMLICAMDMERRGELKNHTVVTTVMSNYGFMKAARQLGLNVVKTAVGDRYVMEAMRDGEYVLGGEQSGHVIFLNHNTTGDGVLTALQLVDVMVATERPLSELAAVMRSYPQVLVNVRVADKLAWRNHAPIVDAIARVEAQLGDDGRVLVRESGTESIVRVMVEGPSEDVVATYAESIVSVVKREFGV